MSSVLSYFQLYLHNLYSKNNVKDTIASNAARIDSVVIDIFDAYVIIGALVRTSFDGVRQCPLHVLIELYLLIELRLCLCLFCPTSQHQARSTQSVLCVVISNRFPRQRPCEFVSFAGHHPTCMHITEHHEHHRWFPSQRKDQKQLLLGINTRHNSTTMNKQTKLPSELEQNAC